MKIKTDEKTKTVFFQVFLSVFKNNCTKSLKCTQYQVLESVTVAKLTVVNLISGSLADPLLQNFLAQMEFEKSMDRLYFHSKNSGD